MFSYHLVAPNTDPPRKGEQFGTPTYRRGKPAEIQPPKHTESLQATAQPAPLPCRRPADLFRHIRLIALSTPTTDEFGARYANVNRILLFF
jgi:hypothetical protein